MSGLEFLYVVGMAMLGVLFVCAGSLFIAAKLDNYFRSKEARKCLRKLK